MEDMEGTKEVGHALDIQENTTIMQMDGIQVINAQNHHLFPLHLEDVEGRHRRASLPPIHRHRDTEKGGIRGVELGETQRKVMMGLQGMREVIKNRKDTKNLEVKNGEHQRMAD